MTRHRECFRTWFPHLASIYTEAQTHFLTIDALLSSLFPDLPFASNVFNFGPRAYTAKHRDFKNLISGFCAIVAFGNFDHTRSGQLVLHEANVVLEIRPGDVVFIPSALITHSNWPVAEGETRMSWTSFTAGGLFRWKIAGNRAVKSMPAEDQKPFKQSSRRFFERTWNAGPTIQRLEAMMDRLST